MTNFEEIKQNALDRLDEINNAKNCNCPLCGSKVDSKTRYTIPKGFTVYGLSMKELSDKLDFAEQHGYRDIIK